ncbi:MAG: hypothetical protein KF787_10845 [Phycisphaeraceae bacterium]|nr:hypothetical protein [Phycisphaeraceae bacterium]
MLTAAGLLSLPALAAALVALWVGCRGRRTDDNPLCRGCGFDLVGLAGVAASAGNITCPECGRDVSCRRSIRVGNRSRRRTAVVVGVALAAFSVLSLGSVLVVAGRGAAWHRVAPTWLLGLHLESSRTALKRSALTELSDRVSGGSISAAAALRLANRVLEIQADPRDPWIVEYGDLVESVWHAGHLSPEGYRRFLEQGVKVGCQAAADPDDAFAAEPVLTDATPVLRVEITRVGASTAVGLRVRLVEARYAGLTVEGDGYEAEMVTLGPGTPMISSQAVVFDRGGEPRATARFFVEIRGTDRDDLDTAGLAAIRFEKTYEYVVRPARR